jgi:Fe-S-cluster containining protein
MPPANFKCKQCGNCCLNLSGAFDVCATEEDIRLWEENDRADILAWVDAIHIGEDHFVYDIWINPRTGDDVVRCPWLRKLPGQNKYICRIQDMKPEHCREYPLSREHAESTGCLGFDGMEGKKRKHGKKMLKADADPYKTRIEVFFRRGGVTVKKDRAGYSIFYGPRKTPTARLRFTGEKDTVEVLWWSHIDKWESIGDFGGIILSLDDALKYIDEDPLGCLWRCPF